MNDNLCDARIARQTESLQSDSPENANFFNEYSSLARAAAWEAHEAVCGEKRALEAGAERTRSGRQSALQVIKDLQSFSPFFTRG